MKQHNASNGRFYEIEDNVFYKSYTTVLSCMPASKFLMKWLKDKTAEESERLLKQAGLKGSKIHHTINLILNGEVVLPSGMTKEQAEMEGMHDEELIKYFKKHYTEEEDFMMKGFNNFYQDYKIKTLKSEFMVWSDKIKCAGTCDFYGYIDLPEDGKKIRKLTDKQIAAGKIQEVKAIKTYRAVIDWKTGSTIYESHYRQVAGYFMAMKEMIKRKILKEKNPQKAFLLHLGVNKIGYKLVEITDIREQYKRFCATNLEWEIANPNAVPKKPYEFATDYKLIK